MIETFKGIAGFGIIAGIFACWSQLKGMVTKAFSYFIRGDQVINYEVSKTMLLSLLTDSKIVNWGSRKYSTSHSDFIKSMKGVHCILFTEYSTLFLLYKKYTPLIVSRTTDGQGIKVTYLYKTFDFRKQLDKAYFDFNAEFAKVLAKERNSNFYIEEISGKDVSAPDMSGYGNVGKSYGEGLSFGGSGGSTEAIKLPFDFHLMDKYVDLVALNYTDIGSEKERDKVTYYWPKEGVQLREEVKYWLENRQWFLDREIKHSRGCLLTGLPGTGKSKLTVEIAKYFGIPITKINLANMTENEFIRAYGSCPQSSIVLIEDIDNVFHGRTNILAQNSHSKNLLSFDALINVIGGAKQYNGLFTIVSTNKIELLDAALTRAGRLDVKIEVGPLDEDGRRFIASNILRDWNELIEKAVIDWAGLTAAEFENNCVQVAITEFYKKKEIKL